jgi:hypothetical protein
LYNPVRIAQTKLDQSRSMKWSSLSHEKLEIVGEALEREGRSRVCCFFYSMETILRL